MAIRKVVVEGDPVLRVRAEEVPPESFGTADLAQLVDDLIETMRSANGVGIAAPQIGVSLRVFIADSSDGPVALANPVITGHSAKTVTEALPLARGRSPGHRR
jgi:peptide deformylase